MDWHRNHNHFSIIFPKKLLITAVLSVMILVLPLFLAVPQTKQDIREHAAGGFPHVVGTQIVDENGNPLMLHGAQLEGELNGNGTQVAQSYNKIVSTMASWHINAIRLPSCNWFWKADPSGYMNKIQNAVQAANQAGLYAIIDLHDDHNCNPPYVWPEPYHLPRPEMDTYWQAVATALKNNPKVIFDIYNEPNIQGVSKEQYTDAQWKLWLNGGTVQDSRGTETFIGMQRLVDVIRQTGAQQILMVEGYTTAETFHNIGTNTVTDPLNNIVYEAHKYSVQDGAAQWDTDFGFMGAKYPVFVGEWALMGGDNSGNTNCGGITSPAQADQVVSTFLQYMDSRHMGWSAYSFDSEHLIVDYTNFTPTSFFKGWTCPQRGTDTVNHAGMGQDIKNYLASISSVPTQTPSASLMPSPTSRVTISPPQTPAPTVSTTIPPGATTFSVTVCPHSIGNCGDNVHPHAVENTNPKTPARTITITVFDGNNKNVLTQQGQVTYNTTNQNFEGIIDMGSLPSGTYLATIAMDGFIPKQVPGIISVTQGQSSVLPEVYLVAGNIDSNNQLDLLDYNDLVSCYGSKQQTSACLFPQTVDINDDGVVDGVDVNLWDIELSVQSGAL